MEMKLNPKMLKILMNLFPDSEPEIRYQHMGNSGKQIIEDLEFLEKKGRCCCTSAQSSTNP